eukprot:50503-Pelagomonas_calceolata.AAC.1
MGGGGAGITRVLLLWAKCGSSCSSGLLGRFLLLRQGSVEGAGSTLDLSPSLMHAFQLGLRCCSMASELPAVTFSPTCVPSLTLCGAVTFRLCCVLIHV